MKKRLLSIALCLAMILSICILPTFAAGDTKKFELSDLKKAVNDQTPTGGTTGETLISEVVITQTANGVFKVTVKTSANETVKFGIYSKTHIDDNMNTFEMDWFAASGVNMSDTVSGTSGSNGGVATTDAGADIGTNIALADGKYYIGLLGTNKNTAVWAAFEVENGTFPKEPMKAPTVSVAAAASTGSGLDFTITAGADYADVGSYVINIYDNSVTDVTATGVTPVRTLTYTVKASDNLTSATATVKVNVPLDVTNAANYDGETSDYKYTVTAKAKASGATKGDAEPTTLAACGATPTKITLADLSADTLTVTPDKTSVELKTKGAYSTLPTGTELQYAVVADGTTPTSYTSATGTTGTVSSLTQDTPYDAYAKIVAKSSHQKYYADSNAQKFDTTTTSATGATLTGPNSIEVVYGETGSVAHTVDSEGAITYKLKADQSVAGVNVSTGAVTTKKVGTETITVSAAANGEYGAVSKDVTVTVTARPLTIDFGSAEGKTLADLKDVAVLGNKVGTDDVEIDNIAWTDKDGQAIADPSTVTVAKGDSFGYTITLKGTTKLNYTIAAGTLTVSSSGGIVISGSTKTYTVTYSAGSHGNFSSAAATTEKVEKNASPKNVPVVHPHDNYRFMGWSLDGKTVVDPTAQKITKDVTFTALYEVCDHMAYMVGRSDTQFAPNGNLTRAEAATILARLTEGFSENGTYPAAPYTDLNASAWYVKYVNFAASKGIVNGRPDGTFDPDASITRAEFATMIANFAGIAQSSAASVSSDVNGHWAAGYISALEQASIVTGYEDGTFRPNRTITRAEAATMVNGAIDRTPDTNLDLAENSYTNPFTDVNAGQWFFAQVMEATVNHVTAHFHTGK